MMHTPTRRTFCAAAAAWALGLSAGAGKTCRGAAVTEETSMSTPSFAITDTHVHFWDIHRLRYPWLDKNALLNKPYLPGDYLEAVRPVSVDRAVFVQAACQPKQALQEAAFVTELAGEYPWIQGIVADAPLEQGSDAKGHIEALAANPLVKGVRRMVTGEKDPEFCLQPDFVTGTKLLGEHNLSFDMGVHRGQLAAMAKLAERCPETAFILCHAGVPDLVSGDLDPWREDIRRLAALPNVACKVSGLATAADRENWRREDIEPAIAHVLECFGFDRAAFASDWPVMLLATSYPRWVDTVMWAARGGGENGLRALFHDTAGRIYRLGQ